MKFSYKNANITSFLRETLNLNWLDRVVHKYHSVFGSLPPIGHKQSPRIRNFCCFLLFVLLSKRVFIYEVLKVAFFRKYDAFFSMPKKCAENYPEKEILKLRSV